MWHLSLSSCVIRTDVRTSIRSPFEHVCFCDTSSLRFTYIAPSSMTHLSPKIHANDSLCSQRIKHNHRAHTRHITLYARTHATQQASYADMQRALTRHATRCVYWHILVTIGHSIAWWKESGPTNSTQAFKWLFQCCRIQITCLHPSWCSFVSYYRHLQRGCGWHAGSRVPFFHIMDGVICCPFLFPDSVRESNFCTIFKALPSSDLKSQIPWRAIAALQRVVSNQCSFLFESSLYLWGRSVCE